MSLRTLLLCLSLVAVAGCGGRDRPDSPSDAELEVRRLEAEARLAEARVREADTAPTDASDAPSTDVTPDAHDATVSTSTSGGASVEASAGGASSSGTRPGLTGLPSEPSPPTLVTGTQPFRFCETYSRSVIDRYVGMELCYTGTLSQDGDLLVGTGTKVTENGRDLRGAARTPFRLEGRLYNDYTVRFNFTDRGERRVSRGSADFPGDAMEGGCEGMGWQRGTFQTDAANSSGTAFLFIEEQCDV